MNNDRNNIISVIHVDDDPAALGIMKEILSAIGPVNYLGGFTNPEAALEFLDQHPVNLIFCDIVMKNKDGFWLAQNLKNNESALVFVTAHNEYALKAFEACSLHYILKPILKEDVEECIRRFKKLYMENTAYQQMKINEVIQQFMAPQKYPRRLFVFNVEKTHIININEMMYAKARANYTEFKLQDGQTIISSKTLKTYDEGLNNHPSIVRAHRSILVNKEFIVSIKRKKHLAFIVLKNGEEIEISVHRKNSILKELEF